MAFSLRAAALCALNCTFAAGPLAAQSYPNRPVRMISGDVGGAADTTSRLLAQGLSANLGQPVLVENRSGGSGALATQIVSKSPADGYTLLNYSSALWIGPLLRDTPWDVIRDFAPVSLVTSSPNVLVVHPSLPVKSVKDLIALAKAKPGALNYASGGLGGSPHLAAELFKAMAGVNIVRVIYKGSGSAFSDLLSGEVQITFAPAGALTSHVSSGRLRALAVTSAQRSPLAPGLHTVAESGLPGFVTRGLYPLFAPIGTPAQVIQRLSQETAKAINRGDIREKFLSAGLEPVGSTPEELAAVLKAELAMWGKLIKDAGIRGE